MQFVKRFDLFGASLPSFNVRGSTEVKTYVGACVSLLIIVMTIAFSILKFQHLLSYKNLTLSTYEIPLDKDEQFDMENSDSMVALALEHWLTGRKDDPRYIQWAVSTIEVIDGVSSKAWYPVQICTDEEFARFYQVEGKVAKKVENLHANA